MKKWLLRQLDKCMKDLAAAQRESAALGYTEATRWLDAAAKSAAQAKTAVEAEK